MRVKFHPAARRELLKHSAWYAERSESAAAGFERAVDHAVERIAEAPRRFPLMRSGRRRFVLLTYPFDVIYRIGGDGVEIMAVKHHRRRPDYWANRK